jgi:phage shock protein PspC (stress-responsive transcriptional regulator)
VNQRHLYRSSSDRIFSGVAGGVADYFEVDPVLVRILWFISVPVTGGLTFLAYIIMMIAVPVEPEEWPQPSPWAPGGDPIGSQAGYAAPAASATGTTVEGADGANPAASADAGMPGAAGPIPGAAGPMPGAAPFTTQAAPTDWRSQRRQERWQRRQERWQYRSESRGAGAIAFGLLLIILGGAFAWNQIDPRFNLSLAWPIAIMAVGAILIASSVGRARHD